MRILVIIFVMVVLAINVCVQSNRAEMWRRKCDQLTVSLKETTGMLMTETERLQEINTNYKRLEKDTSAFIDKFDALKRERDKNLVLAGLNGYACGFLGEPIEEFMRELTNGFDIKTKVVIETNGFLPGRPVLSHRWIESPNGERLGNAIKTFPLPRERPG